MIPSNACLLEMRQLNFLAKDFLAKGDQVKAKELRDRAEGLGNIGLSSDELRQRYVTALNEEANPKAPDAGSPEYRTAFHKMILGDEEPIQRIIAKQTERRDLLVGNSAPQSIFYTAGIAGGYTLPIESEKAVLAAIAAYDPLVSSICDFQVSDGLFLQPTLAQRLGPYYGRIAEYSGGPATADADRTHGRRPYAQVK
jgi:hypothetical protein